MKRMRLFALMFAAALCLLCAGAAAELADDGCWSFYANSDGSRAVLTSFNNYSYLSYGGFDAATHTLTIPAFVTSEGRTYSVYAVDHLKLEVYTADSETSGNIKTHVSHIVFEDGPVMIWGSASESCKGTLASVTFPETLEVIDNSAFADCKKLETLNGFSSLPNLTYIGSSAFRGCEKLTTIVLPESVKDIGTRAFGSIPGLNLTIPAGAGPIDGSAFEGSKNLRVTFQGNYGQWGWGIMPFYGAENSRAVTKDGYTFGWCNSLLYWSMDPQGNLRIDGMSSSAGNLSQAPWTAADVRTVTVGPDWTDVYGAAKFFIQMPNLTSVTVDSENPSVRYQDGILYSWNGKKLTYCPSEYSGTVTISASVTDIDTVTFTGRTGVTGFLVAKENAAYSSEDEDGLLLDKKGSTLLLCPRLDSAELTLPAGVAGANSEAFFAMNAGLAVRLPDGMTSIRGQAFMGCAGMTGVTIPDRVESIGEDAFRGCTSLTSVTIPGSVKSIGNRAFMGCAGMTGVTIPDRVESIGQEAFRDCTSLASVTIPDSVASIENGAFMGCTSLTSVKIPDRVKSIGVDAFRGCNSLTDIYYLGTRSQWDAVSKDDADIPASCTVHTFEDRTRVNLTLTGMTAGDRITLTDGLGTKHEVSESGAYLLWPKGAEMLIEPKTGRRFDGSCCYTVVEGGTAYDTEAVGLQGSIRRAFPLDLALGEANASVSFSEDTGTEYWRLIVEESELDDPPADASGHSWSITDGGGISYGNGSPLSEVGEISVAKSFSLTLVPGGWGCVGGLYQNGSLTTAITDKNTSYSFNVSGDVTLQLSWYQKDARHRVAYDANGGSGRMPVQLAEHGADVTVLDCAYQRTGSGNAGIFAGWNTTADGTGTAYQPGDTIRNASGDLTLYAQWAPAYRVRLKPNYPSHYTGVREDDVMLLVRQSDPDDPDYAPAVTLPDDVFTVAGRAISEWNTDENGNGTPYRVGTHTLTGNLTLYAQWKDAWRVTFDPNGAVGERFTRAVVQENSLTLPDVAGRFQWAVKTFAGWNTAADGSGSPYAAGNGFIPTDDCILYAQWNWKSFAVECTGCSAQVNGAAVTVAQPGTVLTLVPDYRTGYRLKEWQVTPETVEITENAFAMRASDVAITAVFEPLPPFGTATFTLPASLTAIRDNAFSGDEAIAIVDASGCTEIGIYAFNGCKNLKQILLPANCDIDGTAFEGCDSLIAIYAPGGSSTESCAKNKGIPFMPTDQENAVQPEP